VRLSAHVTKYLKYHATHSLYKLKLTVDGEAGPGLVHAEVADGLALVVARHLHGAVNEGEGRRVLPHLHMTLIYIASSCNLSPPPAALFHDVCSAKELPLCSLLMAGVLAEGGSNGRVSLRFVDQK